MGRFLFGIVVGIVLVPVGAWLWLGHGSPPVAVADPPLPFERQITSVPMQARIAKDAPAKVPVEANEATFVAGAHIYRQQCATCHGLYGIPVKFAKGMYPEAPQLWEPHRDGVVGVSDDPPGETYWKVANGIRLSGMPSFKKVLNETEMWQVSQLLANADKPLPPGVLTLLKQPLALDPAGPQ